MSLGALRALLDRLHLLDDMPFQVYSTNWMQARKWQHAITCSKHHLNITVSTVKKTVNHIRLTYTHAAGNPDLCIYNSGVDEEMDPAYESTLPTHPRIPD